jgi:hypothetical protein
VTVRTPEGYAFYSVYPEAYALATSERLRSHPASAVVCIGLRSIGTSLSAVVAAAAVASGGEVTRVTLRPRGDPFARCCRISPALARLLTARPEATFLIADEGPGISGSSLAAAASLVASLGVPDERIVLLPSHLPDLATLRSAAARDRLARHAIAHVPFERLPLDGLAAVRSGPDLGAGAWRTEAGLASDTWPAVHPYHERRKHATHSPPPLRWTFEGLGRVGQAARTRATALAGHGLGAAPVALSHGFLAMPVVAGRPARPADWGPALAAAARAHLRAVTAIGSTGRTADLDHLLTMLEANAAATLGRPALDGLCGIARLVAGFGAVPEVAIDGRMQAHEWLLTARGPIKTDALHHHADHFWPGSTDPTWDVAGLVVELGLGDVAAGSFAAMVATDLGDPGLPRRLAFHTAGYAAFRAAYTRLAADTLAGHPERPRLAAAAERYAAALTRALARLVVDIGRG